MKTFNSFFAKLCLGTALLLIVSCSVKKQQLTLVNQSDNSRTDEPLSLTRGEITTKAGAIPRGQVPLLITTQGDTIPSQWDDLNLDGTWDELAFTASIPADSSINLNLVFVDSSKVPSFQPRTNIRFGVKDNGSIRNRTHLTLTKDELPVPMFTRFQMDGPAWENDKIGFRQYIDGRNARDLYGKTSSQMALDTVGISPENELVDNYHVMEYWGRDILSVGNSLGIGGLGLLNKGKAIRLGIRSDQSTSNIDTTTYQLISEGPVRSIFQFKYSGWQVGDRKINLINQVSIWAGHYRYDNRVWVTNSGQTDTLIVGMVNSNNDKPLMMLDKEADWVGIATHDQQTYNKEWYLGIELILPRKNYISYRKAPESGEGITTSYNALLSISDQQPINYYVLAGWELSNKDFVDRTFFRNFAEQEIAKIQNPVSIE